MFVFLSCRMNFWDERGFLVVSFTIIITRNNVHINTFYVSENI